MKAGGWRSSGKARKILSNLFHRGGVSKLYLKLRKCLGVCTNTTAGKGRRRSEGIWRRGGDGWLDSVYTLTSMPKVNALYSHRITKVHPRLWFSVMLPTSPAGVLNPRPIRIPFLVTRRVLLLALPLVQSNQFFQHFESVPPSVDSSLSQESCILLADVYRHRLYKPHEDGFLCLPYT